MANLTKKVCRPVLRLEKVPFTNNTLFSWPFSSFCALMNAYREWLNDPRALEVLLC